MLDTQDLGRTTGASPSALTQNEPGASDNRLTLDVNDATFDFTKDWSDGESYLLKNVRVVQLSPGEYEVISAEDGSGGGAEGAPPERRGSMGVAAEPGFRNPAIAKLMQK